MVHLLHWAVPVIFSVRPSVNSLLYRDSTESADLHEHFIVPAAAARCLLHMACCCVCSLLLDKKLMRGPGAGLWSCQPINLDTPGQTITRVAWYFQSSSICLF
jgi:hypothetical protein